MNPKDPSTSSPPQKKTLSVLPSRSNWNSMVQPAFIFLLQNQKNEPSAGRKRSTVPDRVFLSFEGFFFFSFDRLGEGVFAERLVAVRAPVAYVVARVQEERHDATRPQTATTTTVFRFRLRSKIQQGQASLCASIRSRTFFDDTTWNENDLGERTGNGTDPSAAMMRQVITALGVVSRCVVVTTVDEQCGHLTSIGWRSKS